MGQITAPGTHPADPMAESHRIDEAIKKLWQGTSVSKEYDALTERLRQINEQRDAAARPVYERIEAIYRSTAYIAFRKQADELEGQRRDAWRVERRKMAAAAKAIYAARHAELLKNPAGPLPQGHALGFDVLSFPRIDGSTSTQPLSVIIAARLLDTPYAWLYPEPSGTPYREYPRVPADLRFPGGSWGQDRENMEFFLVASATVAKPPHGASVAQQRIAVMINSLLAKNASTHDAYVHLIEGLCDLNINARLPSASELKLAREKGVKLACVPIARDALVFIVNYTNPVHGLTLPQIREIYRGQIKSWNDVGTDAHTLAGWAAKDPARKIRALWRERDSGSRELFDRLVPQGTEIPEPQGWPRQELFSNSMAGPYNRVTQAPLALGYSVYYYEHFMAMSAFTRTIAIDGVEPTAHTIASGTYPLTTLVYASYRESDQPDAPGRRLLAWLLSDEGQRLVRESGYVPVR